MGNKQTIFTEEQLDNYQVSLACPELEAAPLCPSPLSPVACRGPKAGSPGSNPASAFRWKRDLGLVTSPSLSFPTRGMRALSS